MARIRTIKPEFWMHEDLSALPEATHMLGAALLNLADDEGYFNANPGLVKASCSPLREPSVSIHDSLNLLLSCGYIGLCTGTDGKRYGRVVKFIEHQRINRPTPSKIKHLCQSWEESVSTHTQLSEDSHPERKGKEQGKERKGTKAPSPEQPQAALPEKPDWLDAEAWDGFVTMRRKERHPLTERAAKLVLNELARLRDAGHDPAAVLDQSTRNGWRDVFPIRTNGKAATGDDRYVPLPGEI